MENKKGMNLAVAIIICLVFVGVLVFISLNKKEPMSNDVNNEVKQEESAAGAAKEGDKVGLNYTGRLEDGTTFDSNVDPSFGHTDPLEFTLGGGQMIPGFEKQVLGMKVGEKKTLRIPPEEAYGEMGKPPVIPPNATLIFEVELLTIN
ncbi:MAG: FKBP-type peptidyl-prolyl cis-trans isomerase [bacterium]|nr:FKBP-type peptidyl-prolyl cis-trans isomerase [bacterium]